ncbi:hypothetical protein ACQ4PT_005301 [Festuca glaucescens]
MDKYTRAVYSVFRERQYHSTAFRIKTCQDNPKNYLVHHYNQSKEFAWSRHEFQVLADEVEGRYKCECKLWEHTGLFCHHVIAVFEHLRLDEIPSRYILQRYTKDAVTNPDFNRRDYRTTTDDGTSIEYRRTILYSEAVKIINKGCSSEAKFQIALSAFRDANSRLHNEDAELENNEDAEMENNEQSSNQDNTTRETDEQNNIPQTENNDPYADIQPPLVAITKGSKTTDAARKNGKCKPPTPARAEPELDEYGRPKGTRVCGTCNKIDRHNSRTCKARQLAKKLLETHEKVYGPTTSSGNIKVRIRNLLARQHIPETEDEEKLDTDEGECFEDETDDEEYENKDEDEDISEQEETQNTPDVDEKLENLNKKEGQRKCSVCNLRQGHYASTCPNKDKILQQQIIERQTSNGAIVKPQGVKACGMATGPSYIILSDSESDEETWLRGPNIHGMEFFDKHCHFGNEVEMTKANLDHLKRQVIDYKPTIPYYVCKVGKTTNNLTRGKMTFNKEYTEEHLKNYLTVPTTIPITSNTNAWVGTRVRINKVATGHAVMTTNWPDVVMGAEIKDEDICMFCFYDGT